MMASDPCVECWCPDTSEDHYMETITLDDALLRIRVEFIEMPDLKLTSAQARRLWNLTQEACDMALAVLVRTGFLGQTTDGRFLRSGLDH